MAVFEPIFDFQFQYGGKLIWLTTWGNCALLVYWVVAAADCILYIKKSPYSGRVHQIRDDFFATIAFPITTFVGLGWIMLLNVYGSNPGVAYIRVWNHIIVLILVWIEMIALPHEYGYGQRIKGGKLIQSAICFSFGLVYLIWNLVLSIYNKRFPYGFQNGVGAGGYILLLLFCKFCYWLGYGVYLYAHENYCYCIAVYQARNQKATAVQGQVETKSP
jgi:hypothetical protein